MIGLFAAVVAIALGAVGPRFRWRGAILLAAATIAIGIVASLLAARAAGASGEIFAVTPGSVVLGLALQAVFMLTFYGLAALAAWSFRALTGRAPRGATIATTPETCTEGPSQ